MDELLQRLVVEQGKRVEQNEVLNGLGVKEGKSVKIQRGKTKGEDIERGPKLARHEKEANKLLGEDNKGNKQEDEPICTWTTFLTTSANSALLLHIRTGSLDKKS